ncbi:mevalonate kinase family protein [Enterobacter asburiae]
MGEHAVLYGCPAIVTALDVRCTVSITAGEENTIILAGKRYTWHDVVAYTRQARHRWLHYQQDPTVSNMSWLHGSEPDHLLKCAVGETLEFLQASPCGLVISVASEIPRNAGFGSSAALSVAMVMGLLTFFRYPAEAKTALHLAGESEKRQHGTPSGIDHHTAFYGGSWLIRRNEVGELQKAPMVASLPHLSIFNSGSAVESTGIVVSTVREHKREVLHSLLPDMKNQVNRLIKMLGTEPQDTGILRECLRNYQAALEQLGVVPEPVQEIIREVEAMGGAAKISGAGSLTGHVAGGIVAWFPAGVPEAINRWSSIQASPGATGVRIEQDEH